MKRYNLAPISGGGNQVLGGTTKEEIVDQLTRMVRHKTDFSIYSSGHCFEGVSTSGSTVLDISGLNKIGIDPTTATLVAGPGTTLGAINRQSDPFNLVLPAGYCQTVALGGHVLGGGIGVLSRRFGLCCDHLMAVEVFTPTYGVITASTSEHPDLFWALKGAGGGNFGCVLSYKFALRSLNFASVINFRTILPVQDASLWIADWQQIAQVSDPALSFNLYVENVGDNRIGIRARLTSTASDTVRNAAALAIFNLGPLTTAPQVTSGSFKQVADTLWPEDYYPSVTMKVSSDLFDAALRAAEWRQILTYMNQHRDKGLQFSIEALGGAIENAPATAFPHRNAQFLVQYQVNLAGVTNPAPRLSAFKTLITAASTLGNSVGQYINYPDRDRTNWADGFWKQNLTRLQDIKRQYDPNTLFNHALGIPL